MPLVPLSGSTAGKCGPISHPGCKLIFPTGGEPHYYPPTPYQTLSLIFLDYVDLYGPAMICTYLPVNKVEF